MSIYSRLLNFALVFWVLALVGCGGGGGGEASAPLVPGITPGPGDPDLFKVSGTIQIPVGSVADTDVMQPVVGLFPNLIPQNISNPSVTGGYVSAARGMYQGQSSQYSYDADATDVFAVSLLEDQVVTLVAFPAQSGGSAAEAKTILRLRAVDNVPGVIATGNNADAKSIRVTATDDYYIEVESTQAPVLYLLTVSQGLTAANDSLTMAYDFVPGEVLVKLKDTSSAVDKGAQLVNSNFSLAQASERAKSLLENIEGLSHLSGNATHGLKMKIDLSVSRTKMASSSVNLNDWPEHQREKWETLNYIETLKARDDIEWAEPNYIRKAFAVSSGDPKLDPLYPAQWHYPLIDVPAAWTVSQGTNIAVAVIDTGIASTHADLTDNIIQGYDFVSQVSIAGDGDGIDSNPEDMGGSFHGSHVAGTIAAVNNSVGGVGVAYEANIMPLRALGIDGSGNDSDIAQAILFAAGLANDSNTIPAKRADVINLSLGGPGFSNSLKSAIDAAYNQGVILVAAAGNENSSSAFYPAAFSNVVSVSAVGQTKELAPYSNFGSTITVAAPGGNMSQDANGDGNVDGVLSTVNASGYAWFQGTSMAAPHVAGVAALMKEIDPGLTGAGFINWLASGNITDDIGRVDQYGYGLINASKAVVSVGGAVPTFLSINPQSLSFDGLNTSSQLTLANGGAGSVVVTDISAVDNESLGDNWLSLDPSGVVGNGLRSYTVNVDRSGKAEGASFAGTITVKYRIDGGAEETKTISVLMTVPDPSKVATVGDLFVGLIERSKQEAAENELNQGQDTVLIEIFAFKAADENQGSYTYSFDDVPAGDYYVFASTNMDQDGLVSDLGEAQGDYPVVGDASLIEVRDADISGLDFNVGYQNFVEGLSADTAPKKRIIRKIPESFLMDNEDQGEVQIIQKQY